MFSFFRPDGNDSPPESATTTAVGESSAAVTKNNTEETLLLVTRLQQENQQLRQELKDAHYRILELEGNLAVFIDTEAQSVADLSLTSSTTTIPTGSPLANKKRAKQQKWDEMRQARQDHRTYNTTFRRPGHAYQDHYSSGASSWVPTQYARAGPSASCRVVYIAESDSSFESAMCSSIEASDASTSDSSLPAMATRRRNGQKFATKTYTNRYLQRVDSADDDDDTDDLNSFLSGIDDSSLVEI